MEIGGEGIGGLSWLIIGLRLIGGMLELDCLAEYLSGEGSRLTVCLVQLSLEDVLPGVRGETAKDISSTGAAALMKD